MQKPEIRKKRLKDLLFVRKTRINPAIEPIVREFKAALQDIYGDRLGDVVLYGSYARGDYDESDIDLMILLNDEDVNTYAEFWRWRTGLITRYFIAYAPYWLQKE
ncbi:nucleotidyltransferase domain-containing protein [Spirosoma sp.]|uniref:nucleotidyltransferase domain-containing protein n=1 Tax=Spirosoma sp. TaxID=1899569 RepID=UPI002621844B|nr:nucleotidyltransferase domain-containing protein [Spirosoma sp.]MCX6215553.1 nucleotidyltransferase domain-containing protein [Spirosoma sp.]